MDTTTYTLETDGATITYDVMPAPNANDRQAPLLMVGQPMTASGFTTLAGLMPDRTVITYDPRGVGRSTRHDGRTDHRPETQAADLHAVIEMLELGPVEIFASSGGAVSALALVSAHSDDVSTLVAHEPPIIPVLPDADAALRARAAVRDAYENGGWGAGMAAFIAMTSWEGEFTDEFLAQPAPDPAGFGLPTDDDGSRGDPLLSEQSWPITGYHPDAQALMTAATRVVIAVGEESKDTMTDRTSRATAELLGLEAVVFPSHHAGFTGEESGYPGDPEGFAARLREVLDG